MSPNGSWTPAATDPLDGRTSDTWSVSVNRAFHECGGPVRRSEGARRNVRRHGLSGVRFPSKCGAAVLARGSTPQLTPVCDGHQPIGMGQLSGDLAPDLSGRAHVRRERHNGEVFRRAVTRASVILTLVTCGACAQAAHVPKSTRGTTTLPESAARSSTTTSTVIPGGSQASALSLPLPVPAQLEPFNGTPVADEGTWRPAGRLVGGKSAVYETTLVPPGGTEPAGIAWMDTHRLSARLYSGSKSPGGGPYVYSAPIQPTDAASLVAAFNGGFTMNLAEGGYFTEGRLIDPLVAGAASFVIYSNGNVDVGSWGSTLAMTPNVVSVRQNLTLLVDAGQPTPKAASLDWLAWGDTCGATSCAASVPSVEYQWRSAVGVTADGALVYVTGPALDPLQLAQLLVRAGVVRGMELDINPSWTVLDTYDPANAGGMAEGSNGSKLLSSTVQGPWTFFEPSWDRDFITMSVRPAFSR